MLHYETRDFLLDYQIKLYTGLSDLKNPDVGANFDQICIFSNHILALNNYFIKYGTKDEQTISGGAIVELNSILTYYFGKNPNPSRNIKVKAKKRSTYCIRMLILYFSHKTENFTEEDASNLLFEHVAADNEAAVAEAA